MKELTGSLEKYLVCVYQLIQENQAARVKDVAEKMSLGAASTSEAIKNLASKGFINYRPYGLITMTAKGIEAAESKILRHKTITKFLSEVLMLNKNAKCDYASQMEFSMPDEVMERFVEYLTFMQKCSCKEPKWVKSFHKYLETGKMQEKCLNCAKNKSNFDNSMCCGCK